MAPGGGEHPEPVVLCRMSIAEAELLVGRLAEAGIEARVASDYSGPYNVGEVGGATDVLVPRARLDEAREILDTFAGDAEID